MHWILAIIIKIQKKTTGNYHQDPEKDDWLLLRSRKRRLAIIINIQKRWLAIIIRIQKKNDWQLLRSRKRRLANYYQHPETMTGNYYQDPEKTGNYYQDPEQKDWQLLPRSRKRRLAIIIKIQKKDDWQLLSRSRQKEAVYLNPTLRGPSLEVSSAHQVSPAATADATRLCCLCLVQTYAINIRFRWKLFYVPLRDN